MGIVMAFYASVFPAADSMLQWHEAFFHTNALSRKSGLCRSGDHLTCARHKIKGVRRDSCDLADHVRKDWWI